MTELTTANDLDARIRRFIGRSDAAELGFGRLALEVFGYQYLNNQPYRRYCRNLGRDPHSVQRWEDIPAIPTAAFAEARLACFPPERSALTFISSGTTSDGSRRSRHELENPVLYDASLLTHFGTCVLPDATSIRMIALAPSYEDAPHSSLSYMLMKIHRIFGGSEHGFFIRDGALDVEGIVDALRRAREPVLLIGTAFAFVHFIDRCTVDRLHFELPLGSRIVETGGFKGKSREIPRAELYASLSRVFDVARVFCVSEYGMCELGSQWYDANLGDYLACRPVRTEIKIGPHWARTLVVDPVSAEPVAAGETGLLAHFDLSNRGSVAAVLTSDLGRARDGGFELLGRFPGAPPKGCSIAVDAMLSGDGG